MYCRWCDVVSGLCFPKVFLVKFNEGQNELTLQHVPISMVAEKKATWRLVLADLHCRQRCLISSMLCLHRLSPNCSLILDDIGLFSLIKTLVFLNYITAWWTGEARFSAPLGVQSQVGGPLADSTKDKWVARSRKNGAFCFCPGEMDRNFSAGSAAMTAMNQSNLGRSQDFFRKTWLGKLTRGHFCRPQLMIISYDYIYKFGGAMLLLWVGIPLVSRACNLLSLQDYGYDFLCGMILWVASNSISNIYVPHKCMNREELLILSGKLT